MSDEQELQDSPQPEEELDLELEPEETESEEAAEPSEDVETLKQRLAESEKKRRELYARVKKVKEPKEQPVTKSTEGVSDADWKARIEFVTTKGRNLDSDDIDEVIAYAKGKGISYTQALDAPVIKSYLSDKQTKKRIQDAIPSPSSKATKVNGKDWKELKPEEQKSNYSTYVASLLKKG